LKRLLVAVVALWAARWLALELASYAGHRLLKPKPRPGPSARNR
jgi:hypothetical protein